MGKHTAAQKIVLGVNIVVVLACFLGALGLVYAKSVADDRRFAAFTAPTSTSSGGFVTPTTLRPATTLPGDDTVAPTSPPETFPPADPLAKNFLITGSDKNACVDPDSPWSNAADPDRPGGERPDSIMMIRIDPSTNRAAVLSFPRDLWVDRPGGGKGRINSTYKPDNPQVLIDTIFLNFGIPVDFYIQVDFCAFKRIVDAVGGVSVPFDTPIRDPNVQLLIEQPGCHRFVGDEALAYVRSRKMEYLDSDGEWKREGLSDLARISRQQDFLWRTLEAALGQGLFNPSVARGLIETFTKDITVSKGSAPMTIDEMLEFVGVIRSLDPKNIPLYQIEGSRLITSGQDVLEPRLNGDIMRPVLAIFRGEAALSAAPADPSTTTTLPDGSTATTVAPGSATTVPGAPPATDPPENVKGEILPSDAVC